MGIIKKKKVKIHGRVVIASLLREAKWVNCHEPVLGLVRTAPDEIQWMNLYHRSTYKNIHIHVRCVYVIDSYFCRSYVQLNVVSKNPFLSIIGYSLSNQIMDWGVLFNLLGLATPNSWNQMGPDSTVVSQTTIH